MTSDSGVVRSAAGVLAVASLSALIVNANTSAVTILLPAISADTGSSTDFLQWAVTGYSLVGAAVIVTSGALGDVFGRRKIFIGGLLLFIASCVFIALAQTGDGVVIGRMIQGAAGSTILACGMSLLAVSASGAAQVRAVSLWGAASAAGAAAGPLLAGLLVDTAGWQSLFWVDAAIAVICVPWIMRSIGETSDPNRPRSIDWTGTVLIAVILAPLILAFSKGQDWGWASAGTLACFATTVLATIAFFKVEANVKAPLVDLALLRNRTLVGATIAILVSAGTLNGLMYLLSLYFQDPNALGMSALDAGLAMLPATVAMILFATLTAKLASRFGARPIVMLGFLLMTVSFIGFAFVEPGWGYAMFVLPLIGVALGMGFVNSPSSSVSTSCVSPDQVGSASGISNMARYVGAAVVTAAVAAVYSGTIANKAADGASQALASALSYSSILVAAICALTILAAAVIKRRREGDDANEIGRSAAAHSHTLPTP